MENMGEQRGITLLPHRFDALRAVLSIQVKDYQRAVFPADAH